MDFVVYAKDHQDAGALDRRLAAREAHIKCIDELRTSGHASYGAALLDDSGKMIGSVILCNFESRAELDKWLAVEPYITGKVWDTVEVHVCKLGPSFVKA